MDESLEESPQHASSLDTAMSDESSPAPSRTPTPPPPPPPQRPRTRASTQASRTPTNSEPLSESPPQGNPSSSPRPTLPVSHSEPILEGATQDEYFGGWTPPTPTPSARGRGTRGQRGRPPGRPPGRGSGRRAESSPAVLAAHDGDEQVPTCDANSAYNNVVDLLIGDLRVDNDDDDDIAAADGSSKKTGSGKKGSSKKVWRPTHVYIFMDREHPSHLKIGMSKHPRRRKTQIAYSCCVEGLEEKFSSEILMPEHAKLVEKLAHAELKFFQRPYLCNSCGGVWHGEYFEITQDVAVRVINRWISFLSLKPHDEKTGLFRKDWIIKMMTFRSKNMVVQDHENHEARHEWWTKLVKELTTEVKVIPTRATTTQDTGFRWQVWCIVEAFVLFNTPCGWFLRNFIFLPNLMVVVSIWVLINMSSVINTQPGIFEPELFKAAVEFWKTYVRPKAKSA